MGVYGGLPRFMIFTLALWMVLFLILLGMNSYFTHVYYLSLIAYIAWAAVIVLFLQTIVNLVLINTASTEPLALGLINSAFFVAWIVLSVGYPVAAAKSGVFADNRVCNTHYAEAYGSGCGNVRIAIAMLVMILLAALSTCWSIFFGVFRRYKDVRAGENVDDVSYANGNAPAGAAPVLQPTCDV